MSVFGENGRMSPTLAAWIPNIAGAITGIILVARANR
jgi:lipopolysaccharide export LptBFGC system permease protein LptF